MNKYNELYAPPAPFAFITLRNIDTSEISRDVPMLIDTGSDITLLPLDFCSQIGIQIESKETVDLFGFDGSMSSGFYVKAELRFGGKRFRGKFVAYDQTEGILGRNILNEFSLIFDGPALSWDFVGNLYK